MDSKFADYINPVIEAINGLGGSARPQEVYKYIARKMELSDEVLNEEKSSGGSKYENQVAWARFYLAKADIIDSSKHGVWSLTDKGRSINRLGGNEIKALIRDVQTQSPPSNKKAKSSNIIIRKKAESQAEEISEDSPPNDNGDYRGQLLSLVKKLPPSGFESLCQRLLREAGFQEVTVTGKSGDGGIDGIGILNINPFVSFKVLFQSKRYTTSVSFPPSSRFPWCNEGSC